MSFTGNYTCTVFKTGLLNGDFAFDTDTFKIALYTNSATLNADTAAYTTTGEVSGSGYTAGGETLTPAVATSNGVSYVTFANVSWSAAITARGALIYKSGSGNPAVCVLDFGSDKTSVTTFTVQFPAATATSAIIRLS
jgi:hypothetical protein